MKDNKSYTELEVWKRSRELVKEVYVVTKSFPHEELYALVSQMRRAAVSIPSNIAEGIGRNTAKDTTQFLFIAKGSLYELETQFYLSADLGYTTEADIKAQLSSIEQCKKLLFGFIAYYQKKTAK